MKTLDKILQEINNNSKYFTDGDKKISTEKVKEIVRNHLCGENGENFGKDNGWIPMGNLIDCMPKHKHETQIVWITIETKQGNRFTVKGFTRHWKFYFSNGFEIKKYSVVAWKPYNVPEPYMKDLEVK